MKKIFTFTFILLSVISLSGCYISGCYSAPKKKDYKIVENSITDTITLAEIEYKFTNVGYCSSYTNALKSDKENYGLYVLKVNFYNPTNKSIEVSDDFSLTIDNDYVFGGILYNPYCTYSFRTHTLSPLEYENNYVIVFEIPSTLQFSKNIEFKFFSLKGKDLNKHKILLNND